MALSHDLPKRFVKHAVRRVPFSASRPASELTSTILKKATRSYRLQPRATTSSKIIQTQTSSLEPITVAIIVGGLVGLFLVFIFVGLLLKWLNKPKSEAHHQYSKAMFQPSAAGYGSTKAAAKNESSHDVSVNVGLLDSAQPMGFGGRFEEGDSSVGSSQGAEDTQRNHARGHARGLSSGIDLPGPTAAFRRNPSGQHPPISAENSFDGPPGSGFTPVVSPDGSSFIPGQIFNHSAVHGGAPAPNQQSGPPNGLLPRRTSLIHPSQRPIGRGPPPINNRRSGRYANGSESGMRRSRIDSVGPGTYRKSMFLSDMAAPDFNGSSSMRRFPSKEGRDTVGVLRRVESIGKGDARRSSRYLGAGGSRVSRVPSLMEEGGQENRMSGLPSGLMSQDNLMAAQAEGWGSGRISPGDIVGAGSQSNATPGPLGPLGRSDTQPSSFQLLQQQQMQSEQQYQHSQNQPTRGPPGQAGQPMGYGPGYLAQQRPRPGFPMASGYAGPRGLYPGRPMAVEGVGSGGGRQLM